MTKVTCKIKKENDSKKLRVKIIKAPLVNTILLKQIIFARSRAVVLSA